MAAPSAKEQALQDELQDYLEENNVNKLFVEIVESLLMAKPKNPVAHIFDFIAARFMSLILCGWEGETGALVKCIMLVGASSSGKKGVSHGKWKRII